MIGMSKTSSSSTLVDRHTTGSKNPSISTSVKEREVLRCMTELCYNRVICRCSVCSEYLCYDHAHLHRHSMANLEILK